MPGIVLPEQPDECAVYKDWRIRQDEEEASSSPSPPHKPEEPS